MLLLNTLLLVLLNTLLLLLAEAPPPNSNDRSACNIPKLPISVLTNNSSLPAFPVIYTGVPSRQWALAEQASRHNLLLNHGAAEVTLSSSNAYSHGKRICSLAQYILTYVDARSGCIGGGSNSGGRGSSSSDSRSGSSSSSSSSSSSDTRDNSSSRGRDSSANETFYLFGDNFGGPLGQLSQLYLDPPCAYCATAGVRTIGLGGAGSGVSFHLHGPGYSEVVIGSKRWFLFPPAVSPLVSKFDPNMTVSQWVQGVYVDIKGQTATSTASTASAPSIYQAWHVDVEVYIELEADGDGDGDAEEDPAELLSQTHQDSSANPLPQTHTQPAHAQPTHTQPTHTQPTQPMPPMPPKPAQDRDLQLLAANLWECEIAPGEVLYFPPMWMHATLNTAPYNVFMSVFIDPQLIK
ncbi:hypothetical protein B484DRAFT_98415 [Ochromonadaceae sp. CCMP2298]|nr:hypothetical protein B484DRAFT_98415 [Ochromonadaceae sp. CCMP2298]